MHSRPPNEMPAEYGFLNPASSFTMSTSPRLRGSMSANSSPFTASDSLPPSRRVSLAGSTPSPPIQIYNGSDESDEYDIHNDALNRIRAESRRESSVGLRSSGACVHCKSLKVRCEFSPGEEICQRCLAGNHDCIARSRKKRKAAPTHEDLEEKSNRQDRQIETLLIQFEKLKTDQKIKEWMDSAQYESGSAEGPVSKKQSRSNIDGSAATAVSAYFKAGAPHGKRSQLLSVPDIVKYCGLYPEEIFNLFSIFFERVNPYFSILDSELHTPEKLIWACPFLFTTICAIASRYYRGRSNLYPLAMNFAKDAAGKALTESAKRVDIVQAYLLLAVYPVPKKKWSDDRSWLLMGVAFRMAIELGLNQPLPPDNDERESLNRTRTWLNCFCVDGSHATQFGKMPMIPLNDHLARNSRDWYQNSPLASPYDVHLCAYVDILLVFADFRSTVGTDNLHERVNEGFDVVSVAIQYDETLAERMKFWGQRYLEDPGSKEPICRYRGNTTQLITAYLRLVVLSCGFQYAVKRGISRDSYIVQQSITVARTVILQMTERLYPTGHLRYALEANFFYVAFAAAFLINFLRPKFIPLLGENQQKSIIACVQTLIRVLGSTSVALDGRHTPALYSRFISSQLAKHNCFPDSDIKNDSSLKTDEVTPHHRQERHQLPPNLFAWPDTAHVQQHCTSNISGSHPGLVYQQHGEADMDFSVQHFMNTVSTQEGIPAANSIRVQPEDVYAEWRPVHATVDQVQRHHQWPVNSDEADAWIRTLY